MTMRTKPPVFFRIFFALITLWVLLVFGAIGYLTYSTITMGPEGVGNMVGKMIRGIEEGRR